DAPDTHSFEDGPEPGRARTNLHAFDDARGVAWTKIRVVNADRNKLRGRNRVHRSLCDRRQAQWVSSHSRNFAGDADDAIPIRPVWRDFQIINHVASRSAEVLGKRLADFRILTQNEQAIYRIAQAQFLGGTEHPVRFDTTNFSDLDSERLLAWFSKAV